MNELLNMQFFEPFNSNISMSKALLLFYVIIASNFTKNLYSGQLRDYFENNRIAQHLIGLITMLVVVVNFGGVNNIIPALIYTMFSYIWFILTTKLDLKWNLVILGLMVIGFMYESNMFNKEVESTDDESLEKEDIEIIKNKNNYTKIMIFLSIFIVTLIGTIFYANKKKIQHGGNFDPIQFIIANRGGYKYR